MNQIVTGPYPFPQSLESDEKALACKYDRTFLRIINNTGAIISHNNNYNYPKKGNNKQILKLAKRNLN